MQNTNYSYDYPKARQKASQLRFEVQSSHAEVRNCIRFLEESRVGFMRVFEESMSRGTCDSPQLQALTKAGKQLEEDSDALKRAMENLGGLHYNLSNLDHELFRMEQPQSGSESIVDRLFSSGKVESSTIEAKTIHPNGARDEDDLGLHPSLELYFDAVGDMKLLRERLEYEIPTEQAELIQERQRRLDQDEILSTTDEEFELSLHKLREDVEAELKQVSGEAEDHLAACIKEGLDTDPMKYTRVSDDGSTVERAQSKVQRWLEAEQDQILDVDTNPLHGSSSLSTSAFVRGTNAQEGVAHVLSSDIEDLDGSQGSSPHDLYGPQIPQMASGNIEQSTAECAIGLGYRHEGANGDPLITTESSTCYFGDDT